MVRFVRFTVLLELFFLPVLSATSQFGYENIKVLVFIFLTSLIGFLWLILLVSRQISFRWTIIKLASIGFIVLLLFSSLLGLDPISSFIGVDPYFQGWLVYCYLLLLSLIVSSVGLPLKEIGLVISISGVLVSVTSLRQWLELNILHLSIPNYAGRVVSTFGQPDFYSGFLLISLPFLVLIYKQYQKITILMVLLSGLAIIASQSRIAILMLVVLVVCFVIRLLLKNKINKRLQFLAIFAGLVIIFSSFLVVFKISQNVYFQEFISPYSNQWLIDNSPEKRIYIWPIILEEIGKNPILGYGLENLNPVFDRFIRFHSERSPAYYGIKNLVIDRSHNYILDLLVFGGLLSLIIWFALIGRLLVVGRKNGYLLAGLLIYLLWIQFQNQSIVHLVYFWVLAGLIDKHF